MKTILLILASVLVALSSYSRTVSGRVLDDQEEALGYAAVVLLGADSTFISSVVTDDDGIFSIQDNGKGKYITVSYIGYVPQTIEIKEDSLGTIHLMPNGTMLGEVVVKASRPIIKRELDRLVFNVTGTALSQGSNVMDLLAQTPLLKVTNNSIGIIGKNGVKVMINGKISYLDGADLMQYLRTLQSDDIASIEVITTPPSRYDAGGNGGMINIVTKRNPDLGWNGSFGASYTQRSYAGESLNATVNYRSVKSFLSLKLRQNISKGTVSEEYDIAAPVKSQHSKTHRIDTYKNYGANITFEHQFSRYSTFGATYDFGYGRNNIDMDNRYNYYTDNVLDSLLTTRSLQKGNTKVHTLNAYYDIQLDTLGKKLGFVANYMHHSPDKDVDFTTLNHQDNISVTVREPNNIVYSIWTGEANLELPFSWAKVETGAKYSDITNKSDMQYYTLTVNGYIANPGRCNQFNYSERTVAGYVSIKRSINSHFSAQAGLRYEHTFAKGVTPHSDVEDVKSDYGKFFPTVYLSYTLNSQNLFNINYAHRINRPYFRAVNPFKWYTNPNNVDEGNPGLKPSFADNLELNYIFRSNLSATVYYQKENDAYGQMMYVNEDNTTYSTYQNIYNNSQFGVNLSYNLRLFGWWNSFIAGNYVYNKSKIKAPGYIPQNGHSFDFRINNTISFDNEKRFQLYLNYSHNFPYHVGITYDRSYADFSAGFKAAFLDNSLIANITANDIFKQDLLRRRKVSASNIQTYNNYYDSRYVTFSLTYKWGNRKLKDKHKTINFQEKSRI